ncbi:MAG: HD domain-containing protein [Myxococcales bacterium]|nr:HD domain-containing protein [Myxococcales bacterium]
MLDTKPLLDFLFALDGIWQDPVYHPEGDALFHSLQVFQQAKLHTQDPELWAAALFHDIGKSEQNEGHAEIGAEMLEDLVSPRVVWLVEHHMDLLYTPKLIRRQLRGSERLRDLEKLHQWDIAGRDPHAWAPHPEEAIEQLSFQFVSPQPPRKGTR